MQTPMNDQAEKIGQREDPPGFCVLLVEDDEADAYLIGCALWDNPLVEKVVCASNGEEALAMIESGAVSPDLALIDLQLPRMDGFDLLVALTVRAKVEFPMVVLTSSSTPGDAVRGRLRNAIRVVSKPDTVAEMYAVLQTAIEAVCPRTRRGVATRALRPPPDLLIGQPVRGIRRYASVEEESMD